MIRSKYFKFLFLFLFLRLAPSQRERDADEEEKFGKSLRDFFEYNKMCIERNAQLKMFHYSHHHSQPHKPNS